MSAEGASPFSDARIDALLRPLEGARRVLIGVSGGPDSTALLLMASEWAARRGATQVAAATVDHGLRAEAEAEAAVVARLCARLGVSHAILPWRGPKPTTRIQERAREARYRLLVGHAVEIGADSIVTAHHADDQAETVLFRLLRGSGVAGLRGMDSIVEREGLAHFRPLLGIAKADLVAFCRARNEAFASDPSNADERHARVRLRRILSQLRAEGLETESLLRLARRAAEADEAIGRAAEDLDRRLGEGVLDANALFSEPMAVAYRVVGRRIAAIGGRADDRIRLEKIETLANALREARKAGRALSANVAGVLVRLTSRGELRFEAEPERRSRGHTIRKV